MELINPDTDDLNNKNIEINNPTNTSSTTNQDSTQNPSTVQNFISGFKDFFKPKTTSIDIEKDNKENIQEEDSNRMTLSSKEENEIKKEESCRDKLANKIIEKLEVERSIGIFSVLICIGIGLIILSFFLLPIVLVSPKKFSFCFAVGSIFVLISFLFLVGTKNYVNKIMDNKRIFISVSFILSIFIGIGFSLGNHYFISLICSGVQLISMVMFVLTFIPGGRAGIDCIKKALSSPFTKLFINKAKSELNEL
jgi:hypothetical protein